MVLNYVKLHLIGSLTIWWENTFKPFCLPFTWFPLNVIIACFFFLGGKKCTMCGQAETFLEVQKKKRDLLNCLWKMVLSQFQTGFISGFLESLEVSEVSPFQPSCWVWNWDRALDEGNDWDYLAVQIETKLMRRLANVLLNIFLSFFPDSFYTQKKSS